MSKEIIIDDKGCEFQNDCIEYKDISYLKVMPICAIHELSIACHDKVNKCKYYKLYKQLQRLQETLNHTTIAEEIKHINKKNQEYIAEGNRMTEKINPQTNYTTTAFYTAEEYKRLKQENKELKQALEEIRDKAIPYTKFSSYTSVCGYKDIVKKINEVLGAEE